MKFRVEQLEQCEVLVKEAAEHNLVSDIRSLGDKLLVI